MQPLEDSDRRMSFKGRGAWYFVIDVGKGGDLLRLTGEVETLRKAMGVLIDRAQARRQSKGGAAKTASADGAPKEGHDAPNAPVSRGSIRTRTMSVSHKFSCSCPPTPLVDDLDRASASITDMLKFPTELARQLTLTEDTYFRQVLLRHIHCTLHCPVQKANVAGQPGSPCPLTHRPYRNQPQVSAKSLIEHVLSSTGGDGAPLRFIAHFNHTTRWMVTAILNQPDRGSRRYCIEQLIKTAYECRKLCNLNGVMECIASLGSSAVTRLKGTWDDVDSVLIEDLEELKALMGFSNNFKECVSCCVFCYPTTGCVIDLTNNNLKLDMRAYDCSPCCRFPREQVSESIGRDGCPCNPIPWCCAS